MSCDASELCCVAVDNHQAPTPGPFFSRTPNLRIPVQTHATQGPLPRTPISELQCKITPLQAPLLYPKSPNCSAKSRHSRPPVPYPNLPNCPCKSRSSSPLLLCPQFSPGRPCRSEACPDGIYIIKFKGQIFFFRSSDKSLPVASIQGCMNV